jgi:inorganic pyrophosphatase
MEETFIPLNDMRTMKRSTSRGSNSDIDLESKGMQDTLDYRIQAVDSSGKKKISLWHDISLRHIDEKTDTETGGLNFVCEIPKFSR